MSREEVLARVSKVIVEALPEVREEEVNDASVITDDLGADSLDVVEIVMGIEEEFGIDVPDDDVGELKTVGSVVDYIIKKQG